MRISVVTAVYNCQDTLAETLNSVRCQTHHDRQSVVIDGASTDQTGAILQQYKAYLDVLVSEPDGGIYDALNKGIAAADGAILGFMHADDRFAHPGVLAAVSRTFEETGADAVYGDLMYVNKTDPSKVIRYWRSGAFTLKKLRNGWMPPHPTLYVKRTLYEKIGRFDTRYSISADYDWMLRLLLTPGVKIAYIPEVLVHMRVGGVSNRSVRSIVRKTREDLDILRRHRVGGLPVVLRKVLSKVGQFFRRPRTS